MNNFDVGIVKPSVLSYEWKVTDFSTNSAVLKNRLLSPVFLTKYPDNITKWRLWLYPRSNKDENEEYLSIFIELMGKFEVLAEVSLSILDAQNKVILTRSMKDKLFTESTKSWGFSKFVKRSLILDKQNNVLKNDTLKILCEIGFNTEPILVEPSIFVDEKAAEDESGEPNYRLKEFDDFEKLLESEAFSDITFIVEEKKIHVHKAILVSRSPVFEVMFQRYTKNKQENTFEITGIKYEIMKELLRFMYVGKINDIDQQATDLLIAADKYSVAGLKVLCEKSLYKNLNIDNALEYLNLATVCDTAQLKTQIIEFIANNLENVVEKPEFDLFGDLDSKVICEVVRAIARKSQNNNISAGEN